LTTLAEASVFEYAELSDFLNPSDTGGVKITNSPVGVFDRHKLPFTDINSPVHSFQSISPYSGGIFKIQCDPCLARSLRKNE
jgi:hypothetical protein